MVFQLSKKIVNLLLIAVFITTVPIAGSTLFAASKNMSDISEYKNRVRKLKKNALNSNNSKILNFLDQSETFFSTAEKSQVIRKKRHYYNLAVKYYNFAKKEFISFDIRKTELMKKKNTIKNDTKKYFKQNFFDIKTRNRIDNYIRKIEFLLEKNDLDNAQKVLEIVSSVYERQIEYSKKFSNKVKNTDKTIKKAGDLIKKMLSITEQYNLKTINEKIFKASELLEKAQKSVTLMNYDNAFENAEKAFNIADNARIEFNLMPHYELQANKLLNRLITISANLFRNKTCDVKFAEAVRNKIFDIQIFSETKNHQATVNICQKLIAMTDYYKKADNIPTDSMVKAVSNIEIPKPDMPKNSSHKSGVSNNPKPETNLTDGKNSISELVKSRKKQNSAVSENKLMLEKSISVSENNKKINAVIKMAEMMTKKAKNLLKRLENNSLKRDTNIKKSSKNMDVTKGILKQCNEIKETLKRKALENFNTQDSTFDLNVYIKKLGVMEKYLDFSSGIR